MEAHILFAASFLILAGVLVAHVRDQAGVYRLLQAAAREHTEAELMRLVMERADNPYNDEDGL